MVPSPAPLTFQSHVEGLNPPKKLKQNKTKDSSTNKFSCIVMLAISREMTYIALVRVGLTAPVISQNKDDFFRVR